MVKVSIRKSELELILKGAERAAARTNGRVVLDDSKINLIDEEVDDDPRPDAADSQAFHFG